MVIDNHGIHWLTPQEAADFLGLSRSRIYHLRERLTHKKGTTDKSRVFFRKDYLWDDYIKS